MKNKASFLQLIIVVALCVTSCALLASRVKAERQFLFPEEKVNEGLVLSPAGTSFGFEDCARSYENFVSPFNKAEQNQDYELVEKFQSIFTKVSFRYLVILHFYKKKDEYLFLDLRRLLI